MSDSPLGWRKSHQRAALDFVLGNAFGGTSTPLDWLSRAVSAAAKQVLVIACGSGTLIRQLSRPDRTVVGLESAAELVQSAQQRGLGDLIRADVNYLPFSAESFDAVVTDVGLAINDNRALMVAEVGRVLRTGGIFAALAPSLRPLSWSEARLIAKMASIIKTPPQLPGQTEFRSGGLLRAAGLIKAEDARSRFYFTVKDRRDAEALVRGLRVHDAAIEAPQLVDFLVEMSREATVEVPIPFRRILALK